MRGLYVHVPFCARACPYCDFDFVVDPKPAFEPYLEALAREWRARSDAWSGIFDTIYIGGGTPSVLGVGGLQRLLEWLRATFPDSGAVETTVELNPEHVNAALVAMLREFGVGRLSLGVQSFAPSGLTQLGRRHRSTQALATLQMLVAAGFEVSADVIVGWPGQSAQQALADAAQIIESQVNHVSVYALTIEEQSAWPGLVSRGVRTMPDADEQGERMREVEHVLTEAGFDHYEVASYARKGAYARHNLLYWTWHDYLGLGPSAHSARFDERGGVWRTGNVRGYQPWVQAAGIVASEEALHGQDAAREGLWIGLRHLRGLDVAAYLQRFVAVDLSWLHHVCARQVAAGNLIWNADQSVVKVAPGRWYWHDLIGRDVLGE